MAARSSLNPIVLRISYDELVAFADELDKKKEKNACKKKNHAEPEEADEKPAKKVVAKTDSSGHVVSKNSHKKGQRRKESEKLESSDKNEIENARKEAKKEKKLSLQAKEQRKSSSEHRVSDKDTVFNSDDKKNRNKNPEKCDEEVQTKNVLNDDEEESQDYELDLIARTGGVLRLSNSPIHTVDDEDFATTVKARGIIRLPEGFQLTNHETAVEKDEFCTGSEELNERDEGEVSYVQNTPRKQIKDTLSSKLHDPTKGDCCVAQQDYHMDQVSREIDPINRISETVCKTASEISMGNEQTQSPVDKKMKTLNLRQARQLIKLVSQKQTSLSNLLSHDMLDKTAFQKILGYSKEIQELYKAIMMLDLSFAVEEDVDQSLWKNGFYQIIETLRKYGKLFLGYTDKTEVLSQEEINDCLKEFLESAETFYKGLLESLQKAHQLNVQDVVKQPRRIEQLGKNAKLALRSSHHILICLGDITRYQSQFHPSQNWAAIRSWYLKASKLAPKNGKPYNLLAVVAVYANHKLDAVYYYVRSLAVSNPILTAREALTRIYHDIQEKADRFQRSEDEKKKCIEQKRNQAKDRTPAGKGRGRGRSIFGETARGVGLMSEHSDNGRHEVWIFLRQESYRRVILTENSRVQDVDITGQPISENKGNEPVIEEVKELPKITLQEVNRMFVLHFLCAHGLLFTRIGMERLPALQYLLMGEFHTLLEYPASSAVSQSNLLQMMAINMFAIENTVVSDSTEQYVRVGTPQDQAMNLAVEMFINLIKCCCDLLRSISTEEQYLQAGASDMLQGLSAPLRQFLPAVKVFTDWLICHVNLWQASSISTHRVLWESVAQFVNAVAYLDIQNIIDDDGDHMVTLGEDEFLAGFKPLSGATRPVCRVKNLDHKDLAEDNLRCQLFRDFAAFLVSLESPPLEFDKETGQFSAMIKSSPVSPAKESPSVRVHLDTSEHDHEDSDDDVIIESIEDEVDSGDEMERGLKELKAKKDALKKQVEVHKEREDKAKAVIREHISKPQLMLENYPTYLVPDTNCFVDHMNGLRAIVACQAFTLVVPLIVINELDGLKRELHVDKFHDLQHAQYVLENARCAIDFLEFEFSRRNPQMRAVTSKGSELDTIAFRSEDPSGRRGKGCNDDIILSCCLHYCEENFVNRLATANQPITIQRKVVLLTDDRNLRVKAYTRNVPVLTVPQFRKMARL